MGRLAGELFALALLVGKQGGSLGLRSTLAPWLTRLSRERHGLRHGVDHLGIIARLTSREHGADRLDPPLKLLIGHALEDAAGMARPAFPSEPKARKSSCRPRAVACGPSR